MRRERERMASQPSKTMGAEPPLAKRLARALRALAPDASESVEDTAAEAIRAMGTRILPLLVAEFGITDKRSLRAAQAFWVLGAVASPAIPELESLIGRDPFHATFALAGIGLEALPVLIKGLAHRSEAVRSASASGIQEVASRHRLPADVIGQVVPMLLAMLQDFFPYVRRDAISALGEIRARPDLCIPAFLKALNAPDSIIRIASALALGKFGDHAKEAIPSLLAMAESADGQMRFFAIRSMASMGMGWRSDERVVACLVRHLEDPDSSVRGEAAFCLTPRCGRPDLAIPALIEFLRSPENESQRWQAIYSLQSWKELAWPAVTLLLEILREEPPKTWPDIVKDALNCIAPDLDLSQLVPCKPPPVVNSAARRQLETARKRRYGKAKANTEISLRNLQSHPIWLWCLTLGLPGDDDGPPWGDESWMRPLLGSNDVTADMVQPLILLRVKGTKHYACGLYDVENARLDAPCIFAAGEWTNPKFVSGLPDPVVYVAVPTIEGKVGVEFESGSAETDGATVRRSRKRL